MNTRRIFPVSLLLFFVSFLSCGKSEGDDYNGANPNGTGALIFITSTNTYSPTIVNVKKGTRVTWRNNGNTVHTATADDGAAFNTQDILIGGQYSFTPNVVGTYPYHCTHHSNERAELRVSE